jgi:hypothetical protein
VRGSAGVGARVETLAAFIRFCEDCQDSCLKRHCRAAPGVAEYTGTGGLHIWDGSYRSLVVTVGYAHLLRVSTRVI